MALWPPIKFDPSPTPERVADTTTSLQMGVISTMYTLAMMFTSARVYVRIFMTRSFGKDDGVMIFGMFLTTCAFICWAIQSHNGLGVHIEIIPPDQAQIFRQTQWFMNLCTANMGLGTLKTVIGFTLLRFCKGDIVWPWYRHLVWGTIGLVWTYQAVFFAYTWSQCQPFAKYWDLSITWGFCVAPATWARWGLSNSSLNITTDVLFAALPVPVIWRIKLPVRLRVYLIVVMGLGVVTVAFGIIKVTYQLAFTSAATQGKTYQISLPFWSTCQVCTGYITTSCVALRPLLNKLVRLSDTTAGQSGYTGGLPKSKRGFSEIELDEKKEGGGSGSGRRFHSGSGVTTSRVHNGNAAGGTTSPTFFYDGDTGSEEAIVGKMPDGAGAGIVKTTQVTVAYAV